MELSGFLAARGLRFSEYCTPAAVLLVALCAVGVFAPVFRAGRRFFDWLGARPWVSAGVVAGLTLVICAALTVRRGLPVPSVHDEFAYLLTADTFAQGRLSNPTHPMWVFFESMHIFHEPTYQAKYPPGQGGALALGQVVFGHAIAGVWLLQAGAAASFLYALRPMLRPRWAALGAVLCALHPQVMIWSQRYWGGSLGLLGGALLLGGFARLWKKVGRPAMRDAAVMATGAAVLALARPFEGFCFTAILALALVWRLVRWPQVPVLAALGRVTAAAAIVLAPVAAFVGYYNFRVTGNPLRLPYQTHHAKYDVAPLFIVQRPRSQPKYNHRELERFHADRQMHWYELRERRWGVVREAWTNLADRLYNGAVGIVGDLPNPMWVGLPMKARTLEGWAQTERRDKRQLERLEKAEVQGQTLNKKQRRTLSQLRRRSWIPRDVPITALALALALPAALRRESWVRLGLLLLIPFSALLLLETYMQPHYGAPAGALVAGVLLLLLRRLNTWRWKGQRIGRFLARTVLVVFVVNSVQWGVAFALSPQDPWAVRRQQIDRALGRMEGGHLVIVRYDERHLDLAEWVYNRADIDSAKVVWAREMTPEKMRALLEYFEGRRVWLVRADAEDPKPQAYEPPPVPPSTAPATRPSTQPSTRRAGLLVDTFRGG